MQRHANNGFAQLIQPKYLFNLQLISYFMACNSLNVNKLHSCVKIDYKDTPPTNGITIFTHSPLIQTHNI